MSNDYFNHPNPVVRHTRGRASSVNAIWAAIASGFNLLPGATDLIRGRVTYAADSGSANALVVALSKTLTAYQDGTFVRVKINTTNTGATTINVDSLGARSIKTVGGEDLAAGDLVAGDYAEFTCDEANTRWVLTGYQRSFLTRTETAATSAQAAQTAAASSASAASTSQAVAAASQAAAGTSEANAAASASSASTSASSATSSASAAAASASGASTSAVNAAASAVTATEKAGEALQSASDAADSETQAALSAAAAGAASPIDLASSNIGDLLQVIDIGGGTKGLAMSAQRLENSVAFTGATPSLNIANDQYFHGTLTANTTFTFDTAGLGATSVNAIFFALEITQGATPYTITFPAAEWNGGSPPDAPEASATALYVFTSPDGGSTWRGVQAGAAFS